MACRRLRGAIVDVLLDALVLGELPFVRGDARAGQGRGRVHRPAGRRDPDGRSDAATVSPRGAAPAAAPGCASRDATRLRHAAGWHSSSAAAPPSTRSPSRPRASSTPMLDRVKYDVIPVGITPAVAGCVPADFDAATTEGLDAAASQAGAPRLRPDPSRPASSPTGRSARLTSPSPSCTAPSPRTAPSRACSRWPAWPTPGPAWSAARSAWTRSS